MSSRIPLQEIREISKEIEEADEILMQSQNFISPTKTCHLMFILEI